MNKAWIVVGVLLVVIIVLVAIPVGMYFSYTNGFKMANNEVEAQSKQIDNILLRRHDLIPNLVNTVKGYATHEKDVFTNLNNARNQMMQANGMKEKAAANGQFESALSRLLVVVESYPQLKANDQFNRLMDELSGTENRLSVERKRYNDLVKDYNNKIELFPGSIFAGMMGLTKKDYFEVPESSKEAPKVSFD
ncbi:MAG TPA: LemA family protein [Firmicutes bacterium]|jgi:LemA protein|nr:LemA family protein [Bacillota bacterium]